MYQNPEVDKKVRKMQRERKIRQIPMPFTFIRF
jgi:hypothetical protein